jgi:hypothetical protein
MRAQIRWSNKGHAVRNLQFPCVPVRGHLRRKVVDFAASHEAVNRTVLESSLCERAWEDKAVELTFYGGLDSHPIQ